MTARQKSALRDLLASHDGAILHHGDAIGADTEAHDIAVALGCTIVIHPPTIERQRAFRSAAEIRAPRRYLDRNKDIVRDTKLLVAAPAEAIEHSFWHLVNCAVCAPAWATRLPLDAMTRDALRSWTAVGGYVVAPCLKAESQRLSRLTRSALNDHRTPTIDEGAGMPRAHGAVGEVR